MEAVGLEQAGDAVPMRSSCPGCGSTKAVILADPLAGGHRYHCGRCRGSGDLIDFTAGHLRSTAEDAARWFAEQGRVGEVNGDAFGAVEKRRAALRNLALEGAEAMDRGRTDAVLRLLSLAGALRFPDPGFVRKFLHPNAGWLPRERIQTAARMAGLAFDRTPAINQWADSLVFLHESMPGKPCGLAAAAYFARPGADYAYLGAAASPAEAREAGLFGLQYIFESGGRADDRVLAVPDPLAVLRLQWAQAITSDRPAQAVAWYDGPSKWTSAAWDSLADKRRILIADGLSASTLNQAIAADASVLLVGDDRPVRDDPLLGLSFDDAWRQAEKRAIPWDSLFRREAARLGGPWAGGVLLAMERYGQDRRDAARAALRSSRANLGFIVDKRTCVRIGDYDVIADRGCWYAAVAATGRRARGTVKRISNATFRIDTVTGDGATARYAGVIRHAGKEVRFDDPQADVEADPRAWLLRTAAAAGLGRPTVLMARLPFSLVDVACAFRPPTACLDAAPLIRPSPIRRPSISLRASPDPYGGRPGTSRRR